jgi:hypothetical protein
MSDSGHGEKNSRRAYLVCIAMITGNPMCPWAGLSRATSGSRGRGRAIKLRAGWWSIVTAFQVLATRADTAFAWASPSSVNGRSVRPRKRSGLLPSTWPWRVRIILVIFAFVVSADHVRSKQACRLILMRKILKKYGLLPEELVTDNLRSDHAVARERRIEHRHRAGRWQNNRTENSHQPTRRRERKMQGFKSVGSTPPHFSKHALSQQSLGHADVAPSRRRDVISTADTDEAASNFQQRDKAPRAIDK